jgi:hypothetical protein
MEVAIKPFRQASAPRIVDDDNSPQFGRLYHRFSLAAIRDPLRQTLNQEDVNGAFVVAIASLDEGVRRENCLEAVLGGAPFIQFCPDALGNKHPREKQAN